MGIEILPEVKIAYSLRKALIGIGILTALIGALYIYLIYDYLNTEESRRTGNDVMVIFFGGPVYVILISLGIYKVYKRKPVIKINGDFIWWSLPFSSKDRLLPWDEIEKFEYRTGQFMGGGLDVFVKNPEKYFSEKSSERAGQKMIQKRTGTHIVIPVDLIDESGDELLSILRNYNDVVNGKPGAKIIPRMDK
jgi:hypothetical protein